MRRIALSATAVLALTLALAACNSTPDPEPGEPPEGQSPEQGTAELTPVTVGVIPIVDVAPIYLGVEQGIFEDHGLDVTLELAQGGAAIVPAVVSGEYQFGFSNVTSLLLASQQGLPLQVVAAGNFSTGTPGEDFAAVVTPADSDIATAADLSGRTVAVNTLNNIGDSTVRKVVEDAGGDPSAIEFVEMGFPDMPAALDSGQVDAAWILEPHLTRAFDQGAEAVSWNYVEVDPDLMIAVYFASDEYLEAEPETSEAFTTAMAESLSYAEANPEETRAALDLYTEIDPDVQEAMVMPRFLPDVSQESMQLLADLALEYGLVTEDIDVQALLP